MMTKTTGPGRCALSLLACLATLALSIAPAASVQRATWDQNEHLWLNYVGDHPLGKGPCGVHLESQVRRAEWGKNWQQLLLRPGINYKLDDHWAFSAGYAYVATHPYGDFPARHDFPEHRAWEQATFTSKFLGLEWQQRLRLEQRFIGEVRDNGGDGDIANWRKENRIRYMLRTTIPLTGDKRWYVPVWNEVFFNFGPMVAKNDFDQNRAFVGLGRQLTKHVRLETGFMEQILQRRDGKAFEANHTISVWLFSKWPLGGG